MTEISTWTEEEIASFLCYLDQHEELCMVMYGGRYLVKGEQVIGNSFAPVYRRGKIGRIVGFKKPSDQALNPKFVLVDFNDGLIDVMRFSEVEVYTVPDRSIVQPVVHDTKVMTDEELLLMPEAFTAYDCH
jgi:hypothetical protein